MKNNIKKSMKSKFKNRLNTNTTISTTNTKMLTSSSSSSSQQLPILASIDLLINDNNKNNHRSRSSIVIPTNKKAETCLYKDYVLIPSKTKFKHLIHTVFEQIKLPNKKNYDLVEGFLKIENWMPIRLDSISSIAQCPLNIKQTNDNNSKQTSKQNLFISDNLIKIELTDKNNN
jgi:hypothetical protein